MFDRAFCESIDLSELGGPRAERRDLASSSWDVRWERWTGRLGLAEDAMPRYAHRLVRRVCRWEERLRALDDAAILERANALRSLLLSRGFTRALVAETFALTREATQRTLGYRHHPVQILGGAVMLNGAMVEMATGEGKTVTAMLPAVAAALAGNPVHIVTVNDYLAKRDAETSGPIYRALGLSVGLVQNGQSPRERRAAYAADITYCTNKELVFDYLRDRIALGRIRGHNRLRLDELLGGGRTSEALLLRGLYFAIVDEADSVLIDEARTPLIISNDTGADDATAAYQATLDFARSLVESRDFEIRNEERQIELTRAGTEAVDKAELPTVQPWRTPQARLELVRQALTALYLFDRDVHYIVAEDAVRIIDENTGRVMADRFWERGLQQLIEIKESLPISGRRDTLSRITYQRFFRRYLRLAGMSGTLKEVGEELRSVYQISVAPVPPNKRLRRVDYGARLCRTADSKLRAIADRAVSMAEKGRPVLVGTRSVAVSEQVSQQLAQKGAAHVVLNARQDSEEANIIAMAGHGGRITIATNMAGRGTDIVLTHESRAAGGLHVILTEFHETPRIDRQLYGRAGRQGDPGSFEQIVALDDDLFCRFAPALTALIAALPLFMTRSWAAQLLRQAAQSRAERLHARIRRDIAAEDLQMDRALGFTSPAV